MSSLADSAIVAMAFCLSVVLSGQTPAISLIQGDSLQNKVRFTFKRGADGKTADGADLSVVTYESSDGITVTAITQTYSTKRQAERALQKKLKGATKILNRAPKIARTGQRVGTRIVARFPVGDRYPPRATIFWTDGSELHYVGSVSMKHTQEFEKTFY